MRIKTKGPLIGVSSRSINQEQKIIGHVLTLKWAFLHTQLPLINHHKPNGASSINFLSFHIVKIPNRNRNLLHYHFKQERNKYRYKTGTYSE